MKCPQCNGENFGWAKRCDHCGHNLSDRNASAEPAALAARILTTTGTPISLTRVTAAQIEMLRMCWPSGLREWPGSTGKFGLVCQLPSREIMAVKFQQVDVHPAMAPFVRFQNRSLIALALRGYLDRGHRGFIMPCAYVKPKSHDRVETGIAYLVGPHPTSVSVSGALSEQGWDAEMGAGATALIADFAGEVGRVIDQVPQGTTGNGLTLGRPIFLTMELRPVSSLGFLDPRVAVLGSEVLVTALNPSATHDGAWDFVARAGLTSLSHAPLVPCPTARRGLATGSVLNAKRIGAAVPRASSSDCCASRDGRSPGDPAARHACSGSTSTTALRVRPFVDAQHPTLATESAELTARPAATSGTHHRDVGPGRLARCGAEAFEQADSAG